MNDRQLRYITAIAREGNLTTAAKSLYISQPSLSNLLEHVEEELGTPLFDRGPGGMKLTAAGECYIRTARQILNCLADLDQQIAEIRNEQRGRLRIGCSAKKTALLFPKLLARLRERFPLYTVQIVENSMEELSRQLLAGELDIAFLYSNQDYPHFCSQPFLEEEVCLVAPADFPDGDAVSSRNGGSVLEDPSILQNQPFVLFKPGKMLRRFADAFFRQNDIRPRILLETDSWQTCIAMAESGEALTFLPAISLEGAEYFKNNSLRCRYITLKERYFRSLSIYYRKSLSGTRILDELLDICTEIASPATTPPISSIE